MPDMLDTASPPPDPAQCAADCRALGARALGLYAINLSVPGAVVEPAYGLAVRALGIQVLPILTPGENPPRVDGVPDAIRAWDGCNDQRLVGLDIEQPGLDTPLESWVDAFDQALAAALYQLLLYTNLRAQYPFGLWWAVNWSGRQPTIPQGGVAVQGSPTVQGPSGAFYDPSWLIPTILVPASAPAPPPIIRRRPRPMFVIQYNGAEHVFYVDAQGQLQHYWQPPGGNPPPAAPWSHEAIEGAAGLVPQAVLDGDLFDSQFHLYAPLQGGGALHAFQSAAPASSYPWATEKLS